MRRLIVLPVAVAVLLAACGDDTSSDSAASTALESSSTDTTDADAEATSDEPAVDEQQFPDVVGVEAREADNGTWSFDVTLSSPYDTPQRYADAWRVVTPDGTVLGERALGHDHQYEQPFTRSLAGVEIPADVDVVVVEGRDQQYGWGGTTMEYSLPGR
ncbi:MAG: hypothetical protein AAGF73_06645 [Actinomycetota bacterium]